MSDVDPLSLDLATLSWLAGSTANAFLLEAIRQAGHPQLRISHGYVFQLLITGSQTIGALAEGLGVTQQAASKSVAELTTLGYLTAETDAGDRRIRRIALSERGRAAVAAARSARAALDARLLEKLGPDAMNGARKALASLLEMTGGLEAARSRRVRAPRLD